MRVCLEFFGFSSACHDLTMVQLHSHAGGKFMVQHPLRSLPVHGRHGIRPLPSLDTQSDWGERALQRTWCSVGRVCVLIGLASAFLSVWPALLFLLLGAWAFDKGDPDLRKRLWRGQRQVSRRVKVVVIAALSATGLVTAATLGSRPLSWGIGAALLGMCAYLATRAEPDPSC
ncbi:MAG: hypothetical protein RJA63_3611 [Pseudomonadota bacterium]|jgi:uncharacterized membrane protein YbaN (DUF454 family)|nr:uncharacterized protein [Pseudomonadota bacterium]